MLVEYVLFSSKTSRFPWTFQLAYADDVKFMGKTRRQHKGKHRSSAKT